MVIMNGSKEGWEPGRNGVEVGAAGMLLAETSQRFLNFHQVTGCDIDITDEFIDVFRDYLKVDGHISKTFAVRIALLNRELVYFSELRTIYY